MEASDAHPGGGKIIVLSIYIEKFFNGRVADIGKDVGAMRNAHRICDAVKQNLHMQCCLSKRTCQFTGHQFCFVHHILFCNMVQIFKRGERRVTFCTDKCIFTGEGSTQKSAHVFFMVLLNGELLNGDLSYDFM